MGEKQLLNKAREDFQGRRNYGKTSPEPTRQDPESISLAHHLQLDSLLLGVRLVQN